MNALSEGHPFVPYRDSILTRLLSDSLGGNCKTTLLICASPSNWNMDESISTLRFGTRAKKVKNKAKINAEKTAAEYKRELAAAKAQVRNLQRLCVCLKRDLKLACEGKLTDPDEGSGARFENGEGIEIGDDDDAAGTTKKKKIDPWATPAATKKDAEEDELVMLESDDDDATSTTLDASNEDPGVDSASTEDTAKDSSGGDNEEMDMLGAADQVLEKQKGDGRKRSKSSGKKRGKRESITLKSGELEELVNSNDKLTDQCTELRQKVTEMRTELMMKSEALIKEKEKNGR